MSDTPYRRQSISFASLLSFGIGMVSGSILVILLCCLMLLVGCKTVGVIKRNNGDGQETCVVIKDPVALRLCLDDAAPKPTESSEILP